MTSAKRRLRRDHLVRNGRYYVDGQQLWTFLEERICHDAKEPPPFLAPEAPSDTRSWLSAYLGFYQGPRSKDLCQGQIVGMRLSPRTTHSPDAEADLHAQLRRTDAEDLEEGLGRVGSVGATELFRHVFPAMVLTSDKFLPPHVEYSSSSLYSVVTVVPLVRDPRLLGKGAPRVRLGGREYAPMTQYLLTLDHELKFARKHPRVLPEVPGFKKQVTDDDTRAVILGEVREFLDLPPLVDA